MSNFIELPFVDFDISTAATTTLIAAVVGKKVRVYGLVINTQAAQLLDFQDTTTGAAIFKQLSLGTNGFACMGNGFLLLMKSAADRGIRLVTANAVKTTGRIYYTQKAS